MDLCHGRWALPWRNPNVVDSPGFKLSNLPFQPLPMLLVRGNIPLEPLHHRHVLGCLYLRHRGLGTGKLGASSRGRKAFKYDALMQEVRGRNLIYQQFFRVRKQQAMACTGALWREHISS